MIPINKISKIEANQNLAIISNGETDYAAINLNEQEILFIKEQIEQKNYQITINQYKRFVFIIYLETKEQTACQWNEHLRKEANKLQVSLVEHKCTAIQVVSATDNTEQLLAFSEGLALSNYQFLKYFGEQEKLKHSLQSIILASESMSQSEYEYHCAVVNAVYQARDLGNEPYSFLDAAQFGREIESIGLEAGFTVQLLNKKKIESLKMGGLLAVNKGSKTPPVFAILEWKPENANNEKPIVLVGKGIVYDTGGHSLKSTANSMDFMKIDMGGAAGVVGAMSAIAKAKLAVHVICLVPMTDNAISNTAYVPGDVITMHSGATVEVLNTDAEGRLVLADALSYAKKYDPMLTIDVATLTGAAAFTVGAQGLVAMGTLNETTFDTLKQSGKNTHERIVEFPLWDEYDKMLKSDIADMKNIGGSVAGSITAGKFLQRFIDYPWVHIDIAGPAFLHSADSYRGKGATGTSVRLLFDFIRTWTKLS